MFSRSNRPEGRQLVASPSAAALLAANGLDSFAALWSLKAPWVEAPNVRRNGWSGVSRLALDEAGQGGAGVYLKRQAGHCYRSPVPPFLKRPTAYREYRRLTRLAALGVAAPQVLYYGQRQVNGVWQAILLTREIPRAIALEAYLQETSGAPTAELKTVLSATAHLIGRFHRQHFVHGALYGKHVMIDRSAAGMGGPAENGPIAYLIDLEKARRQPLRWVAAVRDLSQFYRHTPWTAWQWAYFLRRYLMETQAAPLRIPLARHIHRQAHRKEVRRRVPIPIHGRAPSVFPSSPLN
jgi:tRNA A-37 threonylcarbamoyl transferase component Bud32